jgi:hypothetical protein
MQRNLSTRRQYRGSSESTDSHIASEFMMIEISDGTARLYIGRVLAPASGVPTL